MTIGRRWIKAALALGGAITNVAAQQSDFARAQQVNQAALRNYTWKSRTELKLKGESKTRHWERERVLAILVASVISLLTPFAAIAADLGWPRTYMTPTGDRVQVYQPQIVSWENQRHLVAYVAVGHTTTGGAAPVLGTIKVEADTVVALSERLVSFSTFKVVEANFAAAGRERTKQILADLERAFTEFERVIALDHVLAGLDKSQIRPNNVEQARADPPEVFFSTSPAVLVAFDGVPVWSPIKDTDLAYAVNTNWDVFEHRPSKALFLRNGYVWLTAPALTGPWSPAGTLPPSFSRLPADANWREVTTSLPGRRITASQMPRVFVSTRPAELILLNGAPNYQLVGAGPLLWVSNTESDVFRLGHSGAVYYLVAGRWFSSPDFTGPWTFATPQLPAVFQRIAIDHPRSRVLASVPGTPQAAEAVALAQAPQTARVNKSGLQAPQVFYNGSPQFVAIDQTTVLRAVNTDKDVLRVGDLYYLCFQGVWFASRTPNGPWQVAGTVPTTVYTIPPSSPSYHVTYVTVVEEDDDEIVFAAAAGYTGVTIAWGCAVWGTGWYYPPYVAYGAYYPVYYPYYPTYGYSAWYNPWSGTYQRGAVAYGPYGGVGATALYNPATGTYARGAVAWGPYGANGAAQAYNPRTGTYAQTRQGSGIYGSWGSSYVQRGDEWAQTARATNNVTGQTGRVTRTDDGGMVSRTGPNGSGFVAAGEQGVYAGRDGNVYRRTAEGSWQKYENGTWGLTERPSTLGQLEQDRAARVEGAQRTRDHGGLEGRSGGETRGSRTGTPPRRSGGGGRGR